MGEIFRLLSDYIEKNQLGDIFISPIDMKLSEQDGYQPDLVYIRKDNLNIVKMNYIDGIPDIIIEVISLGSKEIDRGWKKETAERFGVYEYWLVNPLDEELEIYSLVEGKYEKTGQFSKEASIISKMVGFENIDFSFDRISK